MSLVHAVGLFFFFQAEDGIRDSSVTGVQTCALLISFGCFLDCSVLVRSVGLPGALSVTLRENMILRRRLLTESNSDVLTRYSCFAGRMPAVSFCVFSIRPGVGGCVDKTFRLVPVLRF